MLYTDTEYDDRLAVKEAGEKAAQTLADVRHCRWWGAAGLAALLTCFRACVRPCACGWWLVAGGCWGGWWCVQDPEAQEVLKKLQLEKLLEEEKRSNNPAIGMGGAIGQLAQQAHRAEAMARGAHRLFAGGVFGFF